MNRVEFMNRLEQLLQNLPEDEKREAMRYYNDYFDDAGEEREYEVIQELGSPEQVARNICESAGYPFSDYGAMGNVVSGQNFEQSGYQYDSAGSGKEKKTNTGMIIAIIVLVVTAPVTVPFIFSVFSVLISVIIGIFGCLVGFFFAGIGLFIGAVALFVMGMPSLGLLCLGLGFAFWCLEMLLLPFVIWMCRTAVPALYRLIKTGIQKLIQKGGTWK